MPSSTNNLRQWGSSWHCASEEAHGRQLYTHFQGIMTDKSVFPCKTKKMRTEFLNEICACKIFSTFCFVRASISVLWKVLAAGSFLIPLQVVGSCVQGCPFTLRVEHLSWAGHWSCDFTGISAIGKRSITGFSGYPVDSGILRKKARAAILKAPLKWWHLGLAGQDSGFHHGQDPNKRPWPSRR